MIPLTSNFRDFLADIRPTKTQSLAMRRGHRALRQRLENDEQVKHLIIGTFIQGSYRRSTAIRPAEGKRSDVDVVVVTRIASSEHPHNAQERFHAFAERYYKDKWEAQDRSIALNLSSVDLDLVITSAPSEQVELAAKALSHADAQDFAETLSDDRDYKGLSLPASFLAQAQRQAWKDEPLLIPARDLGSWQETHPLAQIAWAQAKNAATNGHYVNVVKALKWWRRLNPRLGKHPKGYPLEHLIGLCCPDGIGSVAEGVAATLRIMTDRYSSYGRAGVVPFVADHGVPTHNVLGRVQSDEFQAFMAEIDVASSIAQRAIEATTPRAASQAWQELFGTKFPLSELTAAAGASLLSAPVGSGQTFPSSPARPPKGPQGFA